MRNISPRGGAHSPLVFNVGGDGDTLSLLTIQIDTKQAQIMTNFKHFFFPNFLNTQEKETFSRQKRAHIYHHHHQNNRDDNAPTPPGCDEAAVGAQTSSTTSAALYRRGRRRRGGFFVLQSFIVFQRDDDVNGVATTLNI